MSGKEIKREAKKKEERLRTKEASVLQKRCRKSEYWLEKGARKAFKQGGSIHDVFFHLMMEDVEFVAEFLKEYLPRKLRNALDLSDPHKIQVLANELYDERVRKHIADMVFVVPCKEENKFVSLMLIVEHKAQSGGEIDHKTIVQLLKYAVLEVEKLLRNKEKAKDKPGVEPIYQPLVLLVYTGSDVNFEAPSWEKSFPLPQLLQIKELRGVQIRFEPLLVNLTRLFVEGKLRKNGFVRLMAETMARASLKRLKESCSTLFRPLGSVRNLTDADRRRLDACVNYVVLAAEEELTEEELEALRLSSENEEVEEDMKTILDVIEERGEIRGEARGEARGKNAGKIEGKLETIQTITSLRFQNTPKRLTKILTELDNLELLEKTRQFALVASSLPDVENFAKSLAQIKPKHRRNVQKQAF